MLYNINSDKIGLPLFPADVAGDVSGFRHGWCGVFVEGTLEGGSEACGMGQADVPTSGR